MGQSAPAAAFYYDTGLHFARGCGMMAASGKPDQKSQIKEEVSFMNIPKDPVMLMSYLNTQLRDHYPSLEALCEELDLSREEIEQRLASIDYHYDGATNQFR